MNKEFESSGSCSCECSTVGRAYQGKQMEEIIMAHSLQHRTKEGQVEI